MSTYLYKYSIHLNDEQSFDKMLQCQSQLILRYMGESQYLICLLYTSDAADEEDSVDLGGRRIIKKKKKKKYGHDQAEVNEKLT